MNSDLDDDDVERAVTALLLEGDVSRPGWRERVALSGSARVDKGMAGRGEARRGRFGP